MKRLLRSLAAMGLACTAHAALDLNSDSVPDVWALVYNTGALTMSADADGDGFTNAQEAAAGTNPMSPTSTVKITSVTMDGYGAHVSFVGQGGKRYQVQSATSLSSPTWQNEGGLLFGTDSAMEGVVAPNGATNKFFRVVISDADTDGDGVSDWEEIKLGFNPNDSHSGGSGGPNDLEAITTALMTPSVVSVIAIDNLATEPPTGAQATDTAAFVVSRTGGLKPITVSFLPTGSTATAGTDYTALPASVDLGLGVKSTSVVVVPLSDTLVESTELVLMNLTSGAGYTVGGPATAGVLIGDRGAANGTGVRAQYWNNTDVTVPQFTNTNVTPNVVTPRIDRIETQVNNSWPDPATPGANVNSNYFVARYTADVLPEFSQIYTFEVQVNRGARLAVNGKTLVDRWGVPGGTQPSAGTYSGTIELQAGKRYPLVLEYMARSGNAEVMLRWSSNNLPEELIPTIRLFPDTAPQITSPLSVLLIRGSARHFYQITASGSPTSFAAANLPPGWTINTTSGLIEGNPDTAGEWDVPITATNANGSGSAVYHIKVLATGGAITRDVWTNVNGTLVSAIPLNTNPNSTGNVTALEGPQNNADNYGARIRGYVTAPSTGVFKFFLTASDAAELWVSDDAEPVNAFKRTQVTAATPYRDWAHANAGKSPLLYLQAGQQYYVEVRHKAGAGNDHVSVGWMQPGEGGNNPGTFVPATAANVVVPGFVLSPYVPAVPISGESTLYVTNLNAQGGAQTSGYGSATLRLSADESQAILSFTYANLTTPVTSKHIHSDAHGGAIIYDIDDFQPAADGSYTWEIVAVGAISAADMINVIKTGQSYLNIHTATYPAGEIRGNFKLAAASQIFTPPAPQTWTDPNVASSPESSKNDNAAARFLIQSTFGVNGVDANTNNIPDDVESVKSLGFEGWIDDQFNTASKPISYHYPYVFANRDQSNGENGFSGNMTFAAWWKNSVKGPDQLRQRVAFALSEILVVSEAGPLDERADAVSDYYDMLLDNSFGNFKDLLIATTLHPAMGRYLDMLGNRKPDLTTGRIPNENYAREILQLFSVGLNRLHPDGSLVLNSKGEIVPTYDQDAIIGFAHAFTGWYYHSNLVNPYPANANAAANWIDPMTEVPSRHFTGQKRLLNNVVLPGLSVLNGQPLDPYANHSNALVNLPEYQALPGIELEATHDAIFQHPNVGPFICRQLIQRLVTATPSRGYLYRVVSKFNDNGFGVRGDMKAVIKAIYLDYEARSMVAAGGQGFGKQREPVTRVTAIARAFPSPAPAAGTYTQVGSQINITTSVPHLYAQPSTPPSIFLDFAPSTTGDAGQPTDAVYAVLATPARTDTTFSIRTKSYTPGINYSQSGGIVSFTETTDGLDFATGESVYREYLTGSPLPTSGADIVDFRSSDGTTIYFGSANTRRATFSQTSNGGTTMTITLTGHGYVAATQLQLDFVSTSGGTALPASQVYSVVASPTVDTFTITVTGNNISRSGTVFVTPAANVLATVTGTANLMRAADFANRTGPIAVTYSDWSMGETNDELNQTPLQSPTVFNFFLPDYQFPGVLANAGLITPEFQLTSETSVIRQANTIYSGLFTQALGTPGLESFKSGGRDLILDLRPWLNGTLNGLPLAHNNNVGTMIDRLNARLLGGQLSSAAKGIIETYVRSLPYTTPTTDQLRTRVRSTIHLVVTSPDFTIQK